MSGSPIIQDGKLAGAVTHVFVQDATRGYGILIENMLEHCGTGNRRKKKPKWELDYSFDLFWSMLCRPDGVVGREE